MRKMPELRQGHVGVKILQVLAESAILPLESLKHRVKEATVDSLLEALALNGLVRSHTEGWEITSDGLAELRYIKEAADRKPGKATPRHVKVPVDQYQGLELQRTSVRPGAYDAFDKPSLLFRNTNQ